jgi:AbrB family looped-hinge helix DNA binding protein
MTATISSKGQLIIPRQVRERHNLRPGDGVLLFELSNGDILIRRAQVPKKSIVWHMCRLRGLLTSRSQQRLREDKCR